MALTQLAAGMIAPLSNLTVSGNSISTSTTTGAFIVTGGVGIGGNLSIGGNIVAGPSNPVINRIWYSSGNPLYGLVDNAITITTNTDIVNHRVGIAFGPANRVGAGIFSNNVSTTAGNEDANLEFYVTKEGGVNSILTTVIDSNSVINHYGSIRMNTLGNISFWASGENTISGPGTGAFVSIYNAGNVVPNGDTTYNLGSTALRWKNIYTGDLHLSNETKGANDVDGTTGNWTIQEGAEDLFIINNKTGKKYRFKLEEL